MWEGMEWFCVSVLVWLIWVRMHRLLCRGGKKVQILSNKDQTKGI